MFGRLGRGRVEGAERDIVGPRLARVHRQVAAGVTGDADLRRRAERARASRGSPSPWPRWTPSAPSRLARRRCR